MLSINKKLLILLIVLFFLTSCAGQSEWIGTSRPDLLIREDGEELTSDHFLSDLEYMMWVLENNFPFFTLADWARDVDIYQLASKAREAILESEAIDEDIFFDILMQSFEPLSGIGHFGIITPLDYHKIQIGAIRGYIDPYGFNELLNSTLVQSFYSERVSDDFPDINELTDNAPQASLTVMEEDSIVIVTIPTFSYISEEARNEIRKMHSFLDDYNHFIIDIRGNGGGNMLFFDQMIMGPFISSTVNVDMYAFFMSGEYITRFERYHLLTGISPGAPTSYEVLVPVHEFLDKNDLDQLVMTDNKRFANVIPARIRVNPNQIRPREQGSYEGTIWMLVDEGVKSAAQIATWIVKDTGFATLVGEVTGGAYGGTRTYSAMPNTGIVFQFDAFYITDRHGRPIEAGTIPDYFNRPGMDALETVLDMIAEGEY